MFDFIRSELYKVLHRRCTKVFFIIFGLLAFFCNYPFRLINDTFSTGGLITDGTLLVWAMVLVQFGWFIVYMVGQTVHSNESKNGVLKNSVSVGIGRTKIYVARFLAELIYLGIAIVILSCILLSGHFVFLGAASSEAYSSFFKILGCLAILWIAALSMAHCLAMICNSNSLCTTIYILYFMFGEGILNLLLLLFKNNGVIKFMKEHEIYIIASNLLQEELLSSASVMKVVGVAIVYFIFFFALGILVFHRKEIK